MFKALIHLQVDTSGFTIFLFILSSWKKVFLPFGLHLLNRLELSIFRVR